MSKGLKNIYWNVNILIFLLLFFSVFTHFPPSRKCTFISPFSESSCRDLKNEWKESSSLPRWPRKEGTMVMPKGAWSRAAYSLYQLCLMHVQGQGHWEAITWNTGEAAAIRTFLKECFWCLYASQAIHKTTVLRELCQSHYSQESFLLSQEGLDTSVHPNLDLWVLSQELHQNLCKDISISLSKKYCSVKR